MFVGNLMVKTGSPAGGEEYRRARAYQLDSWPSFTKKDQSALYSSMRAKVRMVLGAGNLLHVTGYAVKEAVGMRETMQV